MRYNKVVGMKRLIEMNWDSLTFEYIMFIVCFREQRKCTAYTVHCTHIRTAVMHRIIAKTYEF